MITKAESSRYCWETKRYKNSINKEGRVKDEDSDW